MAKKYDFLKAKQIIQDNQETLVNASLGMHEDWFWTAETVWEDGDFTKDLTQILGVGGIDGSDWATPVVRLEHKDGTDEVFECFVGENRGDQGDSALWVSGPLSGSVQANMPPVKVYEK